MRLFIGYLIALCVGLLAPIHGHAATSKPYIIPDPERYAPFLLEPWKPGKPSLIALKDPFCPYCINALARRSQLRNYNVFLIWTPILGDSSVARVKEFFACEAPASAEVLDAVVNIRAPHCSGIFNRELFALNQAVVDNYAPHAVPQYWLGGREVALTQLQLEPVTVDAIAVAAATRLQVDWLRYRSMALNEPLKQRLNIAILLPEGTPLTMDMLEQIEQNRRYNWYLGSSEVSPHLYAAYWCAEPKSGCSEAAFEAYRYSDQEFRLLNGLVKPSAPVFILEGKILNDHESAHLIPADVRRLFSATR